MGEGKFFTSNNAIGKKDYLKGVIIIALITFFTYYIFNNFIMTSLKTPDQGTIAKYISYFLYIIYALNLFILIDRRLFDIFEARDSKGYKLCTFVIELIIFVQLFVGYIIGTNQQISVPNEFLIYISFFTGFIFLLIIFSIAFVKGKITEMTYQEYKRKRH